MEEDKVYHIFNRGNNKEKIFFSKKNEHYFMKLFHKYLDDYVERIAHCLMPNHFHFMIKIKIGEVKSRQKIVEEDWFSKKVSEQFRRFFISYAQAINKQEGRTGSLFQKRFKRVEVADDAYYSWLIAYIHLNPVKAGLCKRCEDWQFSSYREILGLKKTKLRSSEILEWFGGRKAFIEFHEMFNEMKQKKNKGYFLD